MTTASHQLQVLVNPTAEVQGAYECKIRKGISSKALTEQIAEDHTRLVMLPLTLPYPNQCERWPHHQHKKPDPS